MRAQARGGAVISGTWFFDFITHSLLEIVDAGLAGRSRHRPIKTRRADLVKRAMDFADAKLDAPLSIDEIAKDLHVSTRALNYAFKDNLGISPYRYVLTRKLHEVRRELKLSDAPITDIISRYGFETPSRFGRQYLRLYGERPSVTRMRR